MNTCYKNTCLLACNIITPSVTILFLLKNGSISTAIKYSLLASVAPLDVHPTGDQEVAGRPLLGRHIFSWRFDQEIFSKVNLSLR